MVEEIDRRVRGVLGKVSEYMPWIFALTIVLVVLLAVFSAPSFREGVFPPNTDTKIYWEKEAELRTEIDRNLKETSNLLARLSVEMENANYNADSLLANIREKRLELKKLTEQLLSVRRMIAMSGGLKYEEGQDRLNEG